MDAAGAGRVIGAARRQGSRSERWFKRGSLMFIEGEGGTEMFVIRKGKVRLLRLSGESTAEVAVIGPGAIVGELSLLDRQARDATAQVLEDVTADIVDEDHLRNTLEKAPPWIKGLITTVVHRLREATKRRSEDAAQRAVAGTIRVIQLAFGAGFGDGDRLSLLRLKQLLRPLMGLGDLETENVFMHLILKQMAVIRTDGNGQEYLHVNNRAVLDLYLSYLRFQRQGTAASGADAGEPLMGLVEVILSQDRPAPPAGRGTILRVEATRIRQDMERRGVERRTVEEALNLLLGVEAALREGPLVVCETRHLERLRLLQKWLPTFREEIKV